MWRLRAPIGRCSVIERTSPYFEKAQLMKILEADWNARTDAAWKPHPMFSKMTPKEWGKLLLIHVDLARRFPRDCIEETTPLSLKTLMICYWTFRKCRWPRVN